MRIVHIVTQMEAGGAQRVALLLAEGQRQLGHEVEVWFLYIKRPAFMKESYVQWISEIQPNSPSAYVSIMRKLIHRLRLHSPDVVITHTHYANVMGQMAAVLAGVGQRVAVQHSPVDSYPKFARWMDFVMGILPIYTQNVAVSDTVVQSLARHPDNYRKRVTRIYNGIPKREPSLTRAQARARWGLPVDKPVIINVGRLARVKNQEILLKALTDLPAVHLVIVGDGELRDDLEHKAKTWQVGERLHLLGEMANAHVTDVLAAADVFIFPSLYESMGMALVEAMSVGLPVIASDIPAAREVLGGVDQEGRTGLLFRVGDVPELVAKIRMILSDPELRARLGHAARSRASYFDIGNMVAAYERLLK